MSTETLPTKFEDLDEKELFRSALEDFALPVEKKDSKKVLLAAFVEGGVSWDDYVSQHPEVAPEPVVETNRTPEPNRGGVTTLGNDNSDALSVEPVAAVAEPVVRVAETPTYSPEDKLLVKMERENPLFGFRQYTFSHKNPYALMTPADAEYLIQNEDGFRMALPSELREFYG